MNLYLIVQIQNRNRDTFDSAVVAAPDEEAARNMDPLDGRPMRWDDQCAVNMWCASPKDVVVRYLGAAADGVDMGLICASFNAG